MRTIPDPGFRDDDGSPDAGLRAALERYAVDSRPAPVLVALAGARLLVPVVAVLDGSARIVVRRETEDDLLGLDVG